jgi:hypothetical protein
VRDAERCLGGASGLLGRAVQLGPHPYATLSLPAALLSSSSSSSSSAEEGQAVQVLKTPFQVRHTMGAVDAAAVFAAAIVVATQLQPLQPTARQDVVKGTHLAVLTAAAIPWWSKYILGCSGSPANYVLSPQAGVAHPQWLRACCRNQLLIRSAQKARRSPLPLHAGTDLLPAVSPQAGGAPHTQWSHPCCCIQLLTSIYDRHACLSRRHRPSARSFTTGRWCL